MMCFILHCKNNLFFFVVVFFLIHVVSTIYVLFPFIFYLYLGKIRSSHFEQKVVSFFDTLLIAIITRTNSNKEGEVFVFFPYNGKNKNNIFSFMLCTFNVINRNKTNAFFSLIVFPKACLLLYLYSYKLSV